MRKFNDSAIGSLVRQLADNDTSNGVWHALCKSIADNINNKKLHPHDFLDGMENYYRDNDELKENQIMFYAIKAWWEQNRNEDFMLMIKTFKEEKWLKNS